MTRRSFCSDTHYFLCISTLDLKLYTVVDIEHFPGGFLRFSIIFCCKSDRSPPHFFSNFKLKIIALSTISNYGQRPFVPYNTGMFVIELSRQEFYESSCQNDRTFDFRKISNIARCYCSSFKHTHSSLSTHTLSHTLRNIFRWNIVNFFRIAHR